VSGEIRPGDAAKLNVSASTATNHNQRRDKDGTTSTGPGSARTLP